jgi:hypothetical protein
MTEQRIIKLQFAGVQIAVQSNIQLETLKENSVDHAGRLLEVLHES